MAVTAAPVLGVPDRAAFGAERVDPDGRLWDIVPRVAMSVALRAGDRRFLDGCWAGLAERTAVVDLFLTGDLAVDAAAEGRFRAAAVGLCPEEPFHRLSESDWPTAFLVDSPRGGPAVGSTGGDDDVRRWLGGWVIALTVAVQRWARDPVWRGAVVGVDADRVQVAIPWRRRDLFNEALDLAVNLVQRWSAVDPPGGLPPAVARWLGAGPGSGETPVRLSDHFGERWQALQAEGLSPYTLRFAEAAAARGMPVDVLPSCVQIGWGANAQRFDMSFTRDTSWIATLLAKNKLKTSRTLEGAGLPVPAAALVSDLHGARQVAAQFGWPVVVKPLRQDQGLGVTAHIADDDTLRVAVAAAERLSPGAVLVERHIDGDDYRLLVVHDRTLMVVRRTPGGVVGDGRRTVAQLVEALNADPQRGTARYSRLKTVVIDDLARGCLAQQGLDPQSVPEAGRPVWLRRIANISGGGTATDVTAEVHPDNRALAERAAAVVGLDIAGIDLLTTDISRSWREVGGAICEVNAQPAFRVHWLADPTRDVEGEVLDILVDGSSARVPTVAVLGGDEAAAVAEQLHDIWTATGAVAGVCTRRGVRIGSDIVSADDLTSLLGVRAILIDPGVQAAVFELPPDSVRRSGHPCDRYDVVTVLDGSGASTDSAQRAREALVLNADDPACRQLVRHSAARRTVLVTRDPGNPAVLEHRGRGGDAVIADAGGGIVAATGDVRTALGQDRGGDATLFATAVAWTQHPGGWPR